ncbi:MAG: hypothetical protein ACJAUP_001015 [Cellvibrionaceae bacterium]|jgi:hypothetical protein
MSSQLDIVSQIKSYWSQESTGALFLKLTNDKLLQLFFVKGELQSIKYHGLSGMEALKYIPSMVASKSQFHEGAISRIVNELPATSDIINMINDGSFGSSSGGSQSAAAYISGENKTIIETIFTEYVGPIADLIFSEELQQSTSADDLIRNLSRQMDDLDDQVRFREQVSESIKKK